MRELYNGLVDKAPMSPQVAPTLSYVMPSQPANPGNQSNPRNVNLVRIMAEAYAGE